ncbi:hypothetical protein F2Q68_00030392 [Brassica cretica]|uniref:Palmitoyl-protein thioesterase 1 n=1 Tax=Brassica cretica TaxID=69181 RepID=A0A8S9GBE3_BRACR|nr:hypothetical protein F2Q68_00030392 [Brassica cretica]
MALITSAVSRNDEELCRDMFESFIEGMSMQPSPQYCRGVSHLNNVLKLTSTVAGLEKKKEKGRVGKPCECMELEDHIAPSGYIKLPNEMSKYLEHSKYLPKLNNERPTERNSIYKERFTSLHNLVLVMFQGDKVVMPKESCWFGYYPDGATTPLLPPQQTKLYTEDWIGLKTLDAAGKVKFVSVPGEHLQMAHDDVVKHVVPYLQNHPSFFLNADSTKI